MTDIAISNPDRESGLADVLDLLRRLSMGVHAYLADSGRAAGLNAVDIACMGIIRESERAKQPISAGNLGRSLGLSPAATTALLDRMTKRGLAERRRSDSDARIVLVRLTDSARELGRELFDELNSRYAAALTGMDALDPMTTALRSLVTATEQARSARQI